MAATDRVHSPTPEELMAYLDGESPAAARGDIQTHLADCPECQTIVTNLRGASHQMKQFRVEDAPATLRRPHIQRATGWTLPPVSWRRSFVTMSVGAMAMTTLLVVGASVVRRPTESSLSQKAVPSDAYVATLGGRFDARAQKMLPPAAEPSAAFEAAPGPPPAQLAAQAPGTAPRASIPRQPSVIRTATLRLVATDFNAARASVESTVAQAGGFLDQITVNGAPGAARTLTGSLRVPATRLGDALTRLRQLGQVTEDTQGSEDVTDQVVDLDTRLANSRAEEQRLNEILKNRTGKLSDVLEVEQQISRVRLEIEQMNAQRLNIGRRVTYATITLEIDEVRKAGLESGPLSLATRLRVAAADGIESALESIVATVLFVLRAGPATALWLGAAAAIWITARRIRRASAAR